MEMAKEDFLRVREILAEKKCELTPDELLSILNESTEVVLIDKPGLVSYIRTVSGDSEVID